MRYLDVRIGLLRNEIMPVVMMVLSTIAGVQICSGAGLQPAGQEFEIIGQLPGDQMNATADSLGGKGYLVWQDNLTDGEGTGISAVGIVSGNTATTTPLRVNENGADDQENPDVAVLSDGSAVFVWQSGITGRQTVMVRRISAEGLFQGEETRVAEDQLGHQQDAKVAALADGGYVVVWTEYDDAESQSQRYNDVYYQIYSSQGDRLGSRQRVNERTTFNQRSPDVLTLASGDFVVVWISETLRGYLDNNSGAAGLDPTVGGLSYWVDLHCRFFSAAGQPQGPEFYINETEKTCAHPTVGQFADGRLLFAWSSNSGFASSSRWDIGMKITDASGRPLTSEQLINIPSGDQIAPTLGVIGDDALVAWNSRRNDNRGDEVRAVVVDQDGAASYEFSVNSTSYHSQIDPTIYHDGGSIAAIWSGFDSSAKSFELYSQRYSTAPDTLPVPQAPFLAALSGSKVLVSWNQVGGYDVEAYLVHVEGGDTLEIVGDSTILSGIASGTEIVVRLSYRTSDGSESDVSPASVTSTWADDENLDGLPDDWEAAHWGDDQSGWPGPMVDSDGDGELNRNEFLAGTDPTDAADVLRIRLSGSEQGIWANWPTTPGRFYKLQVSRDLDEWMDYTEYRFAPDSQDAVLMDSTESTLYFRVLLRR